MNWLHNLVLPIQASTTSGDIDALFWFITFLNVFFFVLIAGLLFVFITKYKRRSENEVTPHITHNFKLEVIWSVLPLIIVIFVFFWGFRGYIRATVAPGEAIEIQVRAKKWIWEFEYPDGMRTLNTIHVPVNKPVHLVMQSEDVLHSFFVPNFRIKHDIVPGRYTEVWFQATQTGPHQVFCTEYCGKGHSDMLARIVVDDDAAYQKWLIEGDEELKKMPLPELGKLVYENRGCSTCHSLDGSRGQGPSWKGIWGARHTMTDGTNVLVDANYVKTSILEPQKMIVQGYDGIMPTYQGLLRPREVDGVVEYIKTLK
jgi:cytochrome c oxidase subunit II